MQEKRHQQRLYTSSRQPFQVPCGGESSIQWENHRHRSLVVDIGGVDCGVRMSGEDPTQAANVRATVAPEASTVPTVTAGTSEAVAERELNTLIQMAQGELALDTQALTAY